MLCVCVDHRAHRATAFVLSRGLTGAAINQRLIDYQSIVDNSGMTKELQPLSPRAARNAGWIPLESARSNFFALCVGARHLAAARWRPCRSNRGPFNSLQAVSAHSVLMRAGLVEQERPDASAGAVWSPGRSLRRPSGSTATASIGKSNSTCSRLRSATSRPSGLRSVLDRGGGRASRSGKARRAGGMGYVEGSKHDARPSGSVTGGVDRGA